MECLQKNNQNTNKHNGLLISRTSRVYSGEAVTTVDVKYEIESIVIPKNQLFFQWNQKK